MSKGAFDKKFGAELVAGLPTGPGIYLFRNAEDAVIYVGKAKNLRRRLSNYRNASRRRVHRKMRTLVHEASSLSIEPQPSERDALLRENALIRELKPPYNVDGAYAFLYPAIGVGQANRLTVLCFSTRPESFEELGLIWYGSFRSRPRAKAAFDALVELLSLIGHLEKYTRLPKHTRVQGSRVVGFRQVPNELHCALLPFFAGEKRSLLADLAKQLLAKPQACRDAALVQERLELLKCFFETDAVRLNDALRKAGRDGAFVPQEERDELFILSADLSS